MNKNGNIFFDRGEYEQAITNYEAVLQLDPTHAVAKANLELAKRRSGKAG